MTHDTQAARLADKAKRLANECVALWQGRWSGDAKCAELHATIDALRGLAIPAGEAVAWRVSHPVSGDIFRDTEPDSGVYPPSYTVTPLYASPQAAPEASQDGGRATVDITLTADETSFLRAFMGEDEGECPDAIRLQLGDGHDGFGLYVSLAEHPEEGSSLLTSRAALRSPLPGRESTAQAGAGEDEPVVLSMKRSEWTSLSPEAQRKLETMVSAGVRGERRLRALEAAQRAQDMRSTVLAGDAAAPSVLAMREALQGIADMRDRDGNAIEMHREVCGIARAALASTLPEPRAGEAGKWTLLQASIDAVGKRMSGDAYLKTRAELLAASPIATPKPQEREPLTEDVLRDAARYRFIRDADRSDFNGTSFDTIMRYAMEDLDILVDEAIERERAHGIVPQDGDRGEGEAAE